MNRVSLKNNSGDGATTGSGPREQGTGKQGMTLGEGRPQLGLDGLGGLLQPK